MRKNLPKWMIATAANPNKVQDTYTRTRVFGGLCRQARCSGPTVHESGGCRGFGL